MNATNNSGVRVAVEDGVAWVTLARPERANALNVAGWHALRTVFDALDERPDVRVAVLNGEGAHFCAGIDLSVLADLYGNCGAGTGCAGRDRERLGRWIEDLQDCVSSIERCRVPVIAALHGVCFGGAMDIACACDLRYATRDARLCVKELDLAVTADLGVLQRLPQLVGDGRARELVYTAREFDGAHAEHIGLVSGLFETAGALMQAVRVLATELAAKPALALRGTKRAMLYARDHGVADGLRQVADWNAATLLSRDLAEAVAAQRERRTPRFDL
ncbi:crotonase/enoyl-CoA hydratase family protein [Paraburkholderia ferrariae]|uniref:crotonase/enoyl-CoA hydratase family protein n=1 Tax=Paraburkholderia ferrariae TaxID=386056 RepID=UPI0004847D7E|nr:crotonase/enoyl-CoA hydratase family protein [Paraburkholderia ferrariae]